MGSGKPSGARRGAPRHPDTVPLPEAEKACMPRKRVADIARERGLDPGEVARRLAEAGVRLQGDTVDEAAAARALGGGRSNRAARPAPPAPTPPAAPRPPAPPAGGPRPAPAAPAAAGAGAARPAGGGQRPAAGGGGPPAAG